ncbi:hypothetical protein PILCRDRAFT_81537 [Piloderma croceum F 1598]|uniref:Fungal-type protein kinase domain-containing protein n=1 Tax=Piloderma croceum (strain F 1598) TaxID=765440 RepID=A0A0C3EY53_PILCF|nr:hypothetical protein PILCRDRAFT_81537 [Piloderma croceum F 1598]
MLPQPILNQFARIPLNTTIENKYYGVFNKILDRTFNATSDTFTIQPQYPLPQAQTYGVPSIDFVVTYVVAMDEKPIFFLEIKPPGHVGDISSRIAADDQMRVRFRSLYDLTPLPTLHGISAMGPRLAFYCLTKATGNIEPEYVERSRSRITDVVPANRWDSDITTAVGYGRFMQIVNDVRGMVEAL